MNISQVVSALKLSLGLNMITLPFQDEEGNPVPTETVIGQVLETITIPQYSQFVPWIRQGTAHVRDLQMIDPVHHIYRLPAFLTMTPVMYVLNVEFPMHNNRGTFGDISPAYGIARSVEGVATAQTYMMLVGQMRAEPTFKDLGKNRIQLYGFPKTVLEFTVACQHMKSGESIEDSCYDSFMQLATLDMKIFLYNNLKYYENIPTAFGNIQLKIEDYQSAGNEKEELLEKWRDTYHLDIDVWHFM